ncbi:MAG: hypothetical protein O2913_13090 [Chloroflexi bacterium]|nr:hypothetical protein [Chloroflexota bacterium]
MGSSPSFGDLVYANKKRAIDELFGPELRRLGQSLAKLAGPDRNACDLPNGELTRALSEVTACLPIYRTYNHGNTVSLTEQGFVRQAVAEVRRRCPKLDGRALDFVNQVALGKCPEGSTAEQLEHWDRFVAQWRQFTGPVMAKGLEDTSLYSYNPLISL